MTVSRTLVIRQEGGGHDASYVTSQRRALMDVTSGGAISEERAGVLESASVNRSVPTRHVTPENQLVSGLLLHQTRKPSYSLCNRFFASKLAHACLLRHLSGPLNAGSFARSATDAFGTDPVFNSRSSMYDSQASRNVWQFYNASAAAGEVALTGTPYGFFSRKAAGYPDGFPVVLPVRSFPTWQLRQLCHSCPSCCHLMAGACPVPLARPGACRSSVKYSQRCCDVLRAPLWRVHDVARHGLRCSCTVVRMA